MTKAIWVLIIVVVGYLAYLLYLQWEEAQSNHAARRNEAAAVAGFSGDTLPGMPYQLDASYRTAKSRGATAFRTWFEANERLLADPRKAWLQLELCMMLTRENPSEAKKVFAEVQSRVPPSSPVWPKVKELERTFGQ
jgi:hypothetical protein